MPRPQRAGRVATRRRYHPRRPCPRLILHGCLGVALMMLVMAPVGLTAQDRLVRKFGGEGDLVPPIVALAQDSVGFIWAGTRAGLFRYDGARFQRWAPEILPRAVGSIAVSPSGRTVVVDADGRILELAADGVHEVPGTARRSPDHTQVAAFDAEGRLWVIAPDGQVAWHEPSGDWHSLPPEALPGDAARRVFPGGPDGGVVVAGSQGLWRTSAGSPPRRLLDDDFVVDALALDDGSVLALTPAEVVRIHPGTGPEVLSWGTTIPVTRTISLAEREGTVWVGTDRYLIALVPGGAAEVLGPGHGVVAGGPLLVDHEGSLWHGGFTALSQYPEPDTKIWDESHGLRSAHTRFLARTENVVWVTTWQGPSFLRLEEGRWQAGSDLDWWSWGQLCRDGDAGVLLGTLEGILRLQALNATVVHPEARFHFGMCSPGSDGGFWIATGTGLQHLSGDGATLSSVSSLPFPDPDGAVNVALEDGAGRLWTSSRNQICHARAAAIRAGESADWSCEPLPDGVVHLNSLVELPGGILWAASAALGVLHRTATGWEVLPDNALLPTRSVLNLVPSQRGGIWLVGAGILQRVAARSDGTGWTVLEQLGSWHGLPSVGGGDLLEEEDGTIWITSSQGVIQVPAVVRTTEPLPPRMALVEGRVDGRPVPLDRDLVLPADRNRLELRFAALTFRDPGRVRYQVRLAPEDEWADTDGQPSFNWVDLPSGRHRPQVRATLDGVSWSSRPAELAIRVLPPWYLSAWAIMGFALLAGVLLFGLYRARLAYLLGLERQRTRIAMDLHDEMGSGLASIGILAGVLSDDDRDPNGGRRIAQEVAATAEGLGTALSDIVWSLDPRGATLEELAARLAEHGGRLFADDVQFDTEFPRDWPPRALPLPVLRNVLLIGLEALHNVARHAEAKRVTLSLLPDADGWVMTLCDDGIGLPSEKQEGGRGRGLDAMRRRAAEIGGEITWASHPGEGTTVRLHFGQASRRSRLFRWLRRGTTGRAAVPRSHDHASAPREHMTHRSARS